jgi:hypothetical protein
MIGLRVSKNSIMVLAQTRAKEFFMKSMKRMKGLMKK